MITQIHAENFKSWKDTGDLRLAPLTGLFGANNSGKTSILQMLLLMKQTVESAHHTQVLYIGDKFSLIDLGTFSDIIYGHQPDEPLQLSFSWELPKPLIINSPEIQEKRPLGIQALSFSTTIREDSDCLIVEHFLYEFGKCRLGMHRVNDDGYGLTYVNYSVEVSDEALEEEMLLLPHPVKCYGFPDETMEYYLNISFLPDLASALERMFDRVTYLGPLRQHPQRSYHWVGHHPHDIGVRGQQTVAAILAARVEGPSGTRKEKRILEQLKKMKLIHSFFPRRISPDRNDYEFRVKVNEASPAVLITDVGFGVSQILPVLVVCYHASEHSTILLEQPEVHLHPLVQADLADVLIDVVKNRNVQIILESHSEHLLRRLQRRIAEEKISQDKVALYFCRMENSESKIDELEVDKYGNIRNWPQNFFGDEMGDLVAMTDAAMKRETESGP